MSDPLEQRVARVEFQVGNVDSAISKMDSKLDFIVSQVNKITILELNHQQHKETFARAFKRIEDLEEKNQSLANTVNTAVSTARGMSKMAVGLWGAFGTSLIGLIVYAITAVAGK